MIKNPHRTLPLSAVFLVFGLAQAGAQEASTLYHCQMNGAERTVELRENPGGSPACEVWYDKSREGAGRSLLWSANNDAGYCREQAAAFLDKLAGWGWSCSEQSAAIEETEGGGN